MSDAPFDVPRPLAAGGLGLASSVRDVMHSAVLALRSEGLRVLSPTPALAYVFLGGVDGARVDVDVGGGLCLWGPRSRRPRVACRAGALYDLTAFARTCRWLLEREVERAPTRLELVSRYLEYTGFETEVVESGVLAVQSPEDRSKWFFVERSGVFAFIDDADGLPIRDVHIDLDDPGRVASMADALLRPWRA